MRTIAVREHDHHDLEEHLSRLEAYVARGGRVPLSHHPGWLVALQRGLGHDPFCLEAVEDGETRGFLAPAHIRSLLFGRYLVSLPYLNYGGVMADDNRVAALLIEHAVGLADRLNVRFLELRHECPVEHPALNQRMGHKVHMRLELPATTEELWDGLSAKVRNQIRKGQRCGLTVAWGGEELIPEFHVVFSHNMRDLGTPAYGQVLFRSVLQQFPEQAEICVVRAGGQAVAAALLLHGRGVSEVPSASSLRLHNDKNCNMLMYLNLLERGPPGPGVVRLRPVHPGQQHLPLQETMGGDPPDRGVAILCTLRKRDRNASRESSVLAPDSCLAVFARRPDAPDRSHDHPQHPLSLRPGAGARRGRRCCYSAPRPQRWPRHKCSTPGYSSS